MDKEAKEVAVEPAPIVISAEKLPLAQVAVMAAQKLGCGLSWHNHASFGGWYATFVNPKDEEEVSVELYTSDLVIEAENGRSFRYQTVDQLAKAVRGRFRRVAASNKKWEAERDAKRRRDEAEIQCRRATEAELAAVFGEALVEAAMHVDATWDKDLGAARPRVNVYVGRKISGEKLTIAEAVRFAQAMISAGYDLVKMAEQEFNHLPAAKASE